MPVEDVHLVHLHKVQVLEENFLGEEMSGRVQQDAAVGEPGEVHDLRTVDEVLQGGMVFLD